jgi:hypothetical protein
MSLRIVLAVVLELRYPSWIPLGIEHCDNDDGRAASYGDLCETGCVGVAVPTRPAQQPKEREEAQNREHNYPQLVPSQQIPQHGRQPESALLSRGIWRGPRSLSGRHGEVHCVWWEVGGQGVASLDIECGPMWNGGMAVGGRLGAQVAR